MSADTSIGGALSYRGGVTVRQIGCGATALLTQDDYTLLAGLPEGAHVVTPLRWCGMEARHPGDHHTLGQHSRDDEWWLAWNASGRTLRMLPPCPAEDGPDELGDTEPCTLFAGHSGRHTFALRAHPVLEPLHLPAPPADGVSQAQRANHVMLRRRNLTGQAYALMSQLLVLEQSLGEHSTRHLGWRTTQPTPQLARVDADTPGLAPAVAVGYLQATPLPPYEPLFGGQRYGASITIGLTDAGRATCHEINAALLAR